jgi:hypothetical protein
MRVQVFLGWRAMDVAMGGEQDSVLGRRVACDESEREEQRNQLFA